MGAENEWAGQSRVSFALTPGFIRWLALGSWMTSKPQVAFVQLIPFLD
jgi:hypothetical protein